MEAPGALWHVTSRGNERQAIVRDQTDRERFLSTLGDVIETTGWRLHAYVLMRNHYHLLLETPEPNLSIGMRQINGLYGQGYNRRHERVGHLFQGRFHGVRVEMESHLLEVARYVVLNPVRAGIVSAPSHYLWSSYRATAGLDGPPPWLDASWLLACFGPSRPGAQRRYAAFVAEGLGRASPWESLARQVVLGSDAFVRGLVHDVAAGREVPRPQRCAPRPGVTELLKAVAAQAGEPVDVIRNGRGGAARMIVAFLGRHDCGLRLRPLGEALGVDLGHVSRLAGRGEDRAARDSEFRDAVASVRRALAAGRETASLPSHGLTRKAKG